MLCWALESKASGKLTRLKTPSYKAPGKRWAQFDKH